MKNRGLVLLLAVVGIALVVAAIFGPWWVDSSASPMGTTTNLLGPFGSMLISGTTGAAFTGWPSGSSIGSLFLAAAVLAVASLASGSGMVASVVLSGTRPRLRLLGIVLGIIATLLTFVGALVIALYLPAGVNQQLGYDYYTGFWGSSTLYSHTPGHSGAYPDVYGAGWGWYAFLAAAILFLVATLMAFYARRQAAEQTNPQHAARS